MAVRDLDLDLRAGETLCLVGASGSGKSATGLAILRLLEHADGAITGGQVLYRADGAAAVDLARLDARALRRLRGAGIGMVFQDPAAALNPVLKLGHQLTEVLHAHQKIGRRAARRRARALLDMVRLPGDVARLAAYPHELSGGQRQRAMIALALAAAPRILIADEPTTALDLTTQAEILALLDRLKRDMGLALLLITHDMGVVAQMADRVAILHDGRLVECGSVRRVFAAPRHPETRALLDALHDRGTAPPAHGHAAGPAVLELRNLTVRHAARRGPGPSAGPVEAARDISLSLGRGRTLALVGESGCGKTSVARAALRLLPVAGGQILLDGHDITTARGKALHRARAGMQMVFQDPASSLDPRRRLADQVAEPLRNYAIGSRGDRQAAVALLFDRVRLPRALMARYPHEVSGGQRQRAAIARALALRPGLIIADEAVSALDLPVKADILRLFRALQADLGLALLFISHDLRAVARISHDIAVMQHGLIVERGPCATVLNNPHHPHTRALLAAAPPTDPAARRMLPDVPVPTHSPPAAPAAPRYIEVGRDHFVLAPDGL